MSGTYGCSATIFIILMAVREVKGFPAKNGLLRVLEQTCITMDECVRVSSKGVTCGARVSSGTLLEASQRRILGTVTRWVNLCWFVTMMSAIGDLGVLISLVGEAVGAGS